MNKLISYLPPFLREYKELRGILNAEEVETYDLIKEIHKVRDNLFIYSSDKKGIERFERLTGITANKDDELNVRISRVIARWNDGIPYTYKGLLEKLRVLCDEVNLHITGYTCKVELPLSAKHLVNEIMDILKIMLPANMVYEVRILYHTWGYYQNKTWKSLKGKTYQELKEG